MSSCAFLWLIKIMHLLALHGFTGTGTDFTPFAELCHTGTWHCPDLPGHGAEPGLECSPEATVTFIQSQASSLRPQASVLLGYSMGARAALLHAVEYPDRWDALILISPNPGIENEADRSKRRAVDEKLAQRLENDGVATFIEFWQNTPMIRSQKNIRRVWRDAMQDHRGKHTTQGLAKSLREFGQGRCPNLWPKLQRLRMPTLLITGEDDLKYSRIARKMSVTLPNCSHRIIDNAGHMPHLEQAEMSADSVNNFLITQYPADSDPSPPVRGNF